MNRQQIFDKVCNHLIMKQKEPSWFNFTCKYRTDDDKTCAIGCLIPKRDYRPKFDQNGSIDINPPVVDYLKSRGIDVVKGRQFLKDLQRAHDKNADSENFVTDVTVTLVDIARKYHLRQPACIKGK